MSAETMSLEQAQAALTVACKAKLALTKQQAIDKAEFVAEQAAARSVAAKAVSTATRKVAAIQYTKIQSGAMRKAEAELKAADKPQSEPKAE